MNSSTDWKYQGWDSAIFLYFILNYQLNLGVLKFDLSLNFPKKCIILNISFTCPSVSGTASCVWVRPIFMIWENSLDFPSSAFCSFFSPGNKTSLTSWAAAICIAVGKVSFELCGENSRNSFTSFSHHCCCKMYMYGFILFISNY